MFDLTDKAVLVTGAGRGVGRALALRFAAAGAKVAALARTGSELEAAADDPAAHGRIRPIVADVSRPESVAHAVATVRENLGPIEILINNAAIYLEKPVIETTPDEWRRLADVNALGPFLLTREILPAMLRRNEGRIINICSTASHKGYANQSAYCASKHALLGFTRVLAEETHGTGIRVYAISPGGINTAFVRGRAGVNLAEYMDPDEIAEIALVLARMDGRAMMDEVVVRRRGALPFRC